MHADNGTIQAIGNFGNGERGGVGGKDAIRLADFLQLFKDLLLQLHLFKSRFHNQVTVGNNFIGAGGNLVQDSIGCGLLHLPLGNSLLKALGNLRLTVSRPFCFNIAKPYFKALCLCKGLSNAVTHCSRANNTNLHGYFLLIFISF